MPDPNRPSPTDPIDLPLPAGGIDNRSPETAIPSGTVREAVNVDIDDGKVSRRSGYQLAQSGDFRQLFTPGHGQFLLAVKNGNLVRMNAALTAATLVTAVADVSFCEFNDNVYWSDGISRGRIDTDGVAHAWGLPVPPAPQASAYATGGLDAGDYQVCYVYASALEEGGASLASQVTVAAGGGILLSNIPNNIATDLIKVFVTGANGDVFYQHSLLPTSAYATFLVGVAPLGKQLETRFMQPLPAGSILRAFKGRLWSAAGNLLTYSAAGRPALWEARSAFFQFPHAIHALEPVEDGLYVVTTQRAYFLPGANPMEMRQIVADDEGAVLGSGCQLSEDALLSIQSPAPVAKAAFWWGASGNPVVGLPGGQVVKPAQRRFVSSTFERGSAATVIENGVKKLVALLQNQGSASAAQASDSLVSEIRSNGIVIG